MIGFIYLGCIIALTVLILYALHLYDEWDTQRYRRRYLRAVHPTLYSALFKDKL